MTNTLQFDKMNEIGCKGKQKNRYTQILLYFF